MAAWPTARVLTIRDAVIEMINDDAANYTGERVNAKATYLPEYAKPQLKVLQTDVRIVSEETEVIDRALSSEDRYFLEITYQKECGAADYDRMDHLLNVAKAGAKLFEVNREIGSLTPAVVVTECEHDLYDENWFRAGYFYSLIRLTLREYVSNS